MSDKPYKVVIPGVDGGGAQVFEAETPEEMQQQFQRAQENATAKIRELAQQKSALEDQVQQFTPPNADPNAANGTRQQFYNDFYQNPDTAIVGALERTLGISMDAFKTDYAKVRAGASMAERSQIASTFAQKHPELLQVSSQEDDAHNGQEIEKILNDHQWPFTVDNLEAAFAVAKTQGKLKLNETQFAPEARMIPVPSTVSRPTGQVNTSVSEEEFMRTTPLANLKKYLEEKYSHG